MIENRKGKRYFIIPINMVYLVKYENERDLIHSEYG